MKKGIGFILLIVASAIISSCATMPESLDEITAEGLVLNINDIDDASSYNLKIENTERVKGYNIDNEGMSFNGNNSQLMGILPSYPMGNPTVSFSFWIKSINEQEYDKAIINIGSRNHNDRNGILLMQNRSIKFCGEGNDWISQYKLPLNEWKHLVVKKRGTEIYLYVNGSFVESGSIGKGTALESSVFSIGSSGNEENFNGQLDEIYIFDRSLGSLEIKFLSQM